LLSIAVPLAVIGTVGFFIAKRSLEQARLESLSSIADLKVKEIEDFFNKRRDDILVLRNDPSLKRFLPAFVRLQGNPSSAEFIKAKAELDKRLITFQEVYGYDDILLLDPKGAQTLNLMSSAPMGTGHCEENNG